MDILPIFLCGPHCSGKTSMLRDLHREGLISECPESVKLSYLEP